MRRLLNMNIYRAKKYDALKINNESSTVDIENSVRIEIESSLGRGNVRDNKHRAKIATNVDWSS